MTPQFSIIIPTYNRADGRLQRALNSITVQTWRDFEAIIVDDGSKDDTREVVLAYLEEDAEREHPGMEMEVEQVEPTDPNVAEHLRGGRFRYVRHKERSQRVVARNTGMDLSVGAWITHLDSDDSWDQMYLATFAHHIQENPDARLFVCGAIVHGMEGKPNARVCPAWTKIRNAWRPPVDANGRHTYFNSGRVGTGTFVFARECYEEVGPLPPWKHPDDISDGIDEWLGLTFGTLGFGSGKRERETDAEPLIRKRKVGHVGNPYGEDHALFQRLALDFRVYLVQAALYVQYVR